MLPGGRKGVEPMAARVQPHNVRSAHQSMHHLVEEAARSDAAPLSVIGGHRIAAEVGLSRGVGVSQEMHHSVGVAHRNCAGSIIMPAVASPSMVS